jgi:small-conductance mechanosensitive channel
MAPVMNYSRSVFPAGTRFCTVLLLCILALPLGAQESPTGKTIESSQEQLWQPPDIINLPLNWWADFATESPDELQQRMDLFADAVDQKLLGLDGDDLTNAQNLLNGLRQQVHLVVLALEGIEIGPFEPIQTKDVYSLDELLALRRQWRDVRDQQQIPELRLAELKNRAALLQQSGDALLNQYNASDVNSPARLLLGLQRVSTRLEYELSRKGIELQQNRIEQLRHQAELLNNQQEFARSRLESGEMDWQALENEANAVRNEMASAAMKISSLQQNLVEVLSAKNPKPSLELLRRQQLTRALAEQALAQIRNGLDSARINWLRFRSGTLDSGFDIGASINQSEELVNAANQEISLWTATSQAALISPQPASDLNAIKNVELARSTAQESLAIIKQIQGKSDDLALVQEILASEMVRSTSLFESMGTRLNLLSADIWHGVKNVLEYDLFHVGDALVTPGSIIKMLLIMVFGFLLSLLIRRLLDRLGHAQKYAKGSVTYTTGRVLHYVIIMVAFFVALGTIGLDFTNFALIAGALSVGIGFGLQGIVNNFVSGLILLFEGPLRVGDYIDLDNDLRGTVKEINTRATVITTNDNVDVIVPNSELVSTRLTNWTLREPVARLRIPFGVAYGSDKEAVKDAALEAASEIDNIMKHNPRREAQVWLTGFGESSLDFQLLAWVSKAGVRRPGRTRAQFLWALETKLTERGIEIPFPQRDLHLRTGFGADGDDEGNERPGSE